MSKIYYKIVILVMANNGNIYDKFVKEYWEKFIDKTKNSNDIKIFLLYGKDSIINKKYSDNILLFDINESYIPGILEKTILGLKYVNEKYNYKHILRTNLSSFYIPKRLVELSNKLSDNDIYSGVIGGSSTKFISGAGMWLSKNIVDYILENKNKLNKKLPDDVSIGILLKDIKKSGLIRYDIVYNYRKHNIKNIKILFEELNKKNHYHVRLKQDDRNNDIVFLKLLYNNYYI